MSHWNEPRKKNRVCIVVSSQDGRFQSCMLYPDDEHSSYEVYAQRWIKAEEPRDWHVCPEGWVELWPNKRLVADDWPGAHTLQRSLQQQLESEFSENDFTERPSSLESVEEITHPNGQNKARIYRDQDHRYEVQYYEYTKGRGGGWVHTRYDVCTYASTLEAARKVAGVELGELASS